MKPVQLIFIDLLWAKARMQTFAASSSCKMAFLPQTGRASELNWGPRRARWRLQVHHGLGPLCDVYPVVVRKERHSNAEELERVKPFHFRLKRLQFSVSATNKPSQDTVEAADPLRYDKTHLGQTNGAGPLHQTGAPVKFHFATKWNHH